MGWEYQIVRHGNVPHLCEVSLRGGQVLWQMTPVDEYDEDGERNSCAQEVEDFIRFGPPETQAFLNMPGEQQDELLAELGVDEAPWRNPLVPELQEWFEAARKGHVFRLKELLPKVESVDVVDHQHRSALLHAETEFTTSEWLLLQGAEVNLQDRYGKTALMQAAMWNRSSLVDLLLDHGADRTLRDRSGRTAWLISVDARAGHLVQHAVRTWRESDDDMAKAVHFAVWHSSVTWLEGEEERLSRRPGLLQTKQGRWNWTPLLHCLNGVAKHPEAVRWLVENGADLKVRDESNGGTVLHLAAKEDLPWLVDACVKAGVDVNARDAAGHTALSLAVTREERPRLVQRLLRAGADPTVSVPAAAKEGGEETERMSIREVADKEFHGWSCWLMDQPQEQRAGWSGLCVYAIFLPKGTKTNTPISGCDAPEGSIWVEFPAEWSAENDVEGRVRGRLREAREAAGLAAQEHEAPRWLTQEEAMEQPWNWPKRPRWLLFPDGTTRCIARSGEHRPAEVVADLASFQPVARRRLKWTWEWQATDYAGRWEKFSLGLRRGILRWETGNTRTEQSVEQFRVEGPPMRSDFRRTVPSRVLDSLCALIGDGVRSWELPMARKKREAGLETWKRSQPPPLPFTPIDPPPHQSGLWCYAELEIEDHFHNRSGAGSDGNWICWMEFPAEWCYTHGEHLEHWLIEALKRAYAEMNRKSESDPEGGYYVLHQCFPMVLTRAQALKQPWTEKGKVLYSTDERPRPPTEVEGDQRRRPIAEMADPSNPPYPVPVSPPPLPLRELPAKNPDN